MTSFPRSRFEPALRLAIEGRWKEAVRAVVQQVSAPGDETAYGDEAAEALGEVARLAFESGDGPGADEALMAALLVRPHHPDRLHQRAVVRLALGDVAEARALLERALEVDPAHVSARLELSMLEARGGRLGEAVSGLRALDPGPAPVAPEEPAGPPARPLHGPAGIETARRDLESGRPAAALRRVDEMLERQPARADLHALRAEIELAIGALDDAAASSGRALELDPDDADARTRFAIALEGLGLRDQALRQVELVLAIAPEHAGSRALHERWTLGRRRAGARGNPASNRS